MWAARVFFAFLAIAWADRLSAKQYQQETDIAFIRPELPVQKLRQSVPCLNPPERTKRVTWVLRAKDGTILIIGAVDVRQMC